MSWGNMFGVDGTFLGEQEAEHFARGTIKRQNESLDAIPAKRYHADDSYGYDGGKWTSSHGGRDYMGGGARGRDGRGKQQKKGGGRGRGGGSNPFGNWGGGFGNCVGRGGSRGGGGRGGGGNNRGRNIAGGSTVETFRGGANGQGGGVSWRGSGKGRGVGYTGDKAPWAGNTNRGGGRGGAKGRKGGDIGANSKLSLVQKFEKFCAFLRKDGYRLNAIQSIENACTATNLHLKCDYRVEELPRVMSRVLFTGSLRINGIYLARCVSGSKKQLKHEVFQKALDILQTQSIEDINNLKDCGVDIVWSCVERCLSKMNPSATVPEGSGVPMTFKTIVDITNEITNSLDAVIYLKDGLEKLIAYIKRTSTLPEDPVDKLGQAITQSNCGLKHSFKVIDKEGAKIHVGELYIEDTCVARVKTPNQSECEMETYTRALEALLAKPIQELIVPVEDPEAVFREELKHFHDEAMAAGFPVLDGEGVPPITNSSLIDAEPSDRWQTLVSLLTNSNIKDINIELLDNTAKHCNLSVTCVYRRPEHNSELCTSCEVYIDNILLGTGYGSSKAECCINAYNSAMMTLTTVNVTDIFNNHLKLDPVELNAPIVLDYIVKATDPSPESNLQQLKKFNITPKPLTSLKDFVIVEPSDFMQDRKSFAFTILQYSALCNGVLLEWSYTMRGSEKNRLKFQQARPLTKFNCKIKVGGLPFGEFNGYGKNRVRSTACWDGLVKMYETNPAIQVVNTFEFADMVTFSTILKAAEEIRKCEGGQGPSTTESPRPLNSSILKAACNCVDAYLVGSQMHDLVFEHGLVDQELAALEKYAVQKKLMFSLHQVSGRKCLVLRPWRDLQKVVEDLKSLPEGSVCCGFKLTSTDVVPDLLGSL